MRTEVETSRRLPVLLAAVPYLNALSAGFTRLVQLESRPAADGRGGVTAQ